MVQYAVHPPTSFLSEESDTEGVSNSNLVFSLYSYIYWSLWCCEDGVVVMDVDLYQTSI